MKTRRWLAALFLAAGLLCARPVPAQFVPLSRCHQAYPCSLPFGLQNRPDPLIAGPFASAPSSAVSAHIELRKKPEVEIDTRPHLSGDAVDASVRAFLRRNPPPAKPSDAKPAAKGDEQPRNPPGP